MGRSWGIDDDFLCEPIPPFHRVVQYCKCGKQFEDPAVYYFVDKGWDFFIDNLQPHPQYYDWECGQSHPDVKGFNGISTKEMKIEEYKKMVPDKECQKTGLKIYEEYNDRKKEYDELRKLPQQERRTSINKDRIERGLEPYDYEAYEK